MASLVQSGNNDTMNRTYTSTMGYYVITLVSEIYTLQDDTTCDIQISSAGELVVKAQYQICMKENINWYWDQKQHQKVIIVPTFKFLHWCLDVVAVRDVHGITRSVCNRNQAKKYLQRHHICLTYSDRDYIIDEIGCRDKIEYEINISIKYDEE